MGFFERLFGTEAPRRDVRSRPGGPAAPPSDAQALERYRYMLQTAPPETIEQAHQEAFAKLSPEQRRQVLQGLVAAAPPNEQQAVAATPVDDTGALARAATRAEIRQPGVMERTLGGAGMGFGASLLTSFAAGFVGSMVASSFFSALGGFGGQAGASASDQETEAAAAEEDTQYADYGEGDDGNYGGGDMGGGDFEV